MKKTLLTIGVILLIIGLISVAVGYNIYPMLTLAVIGFIAIIWGWLTKGQGAVK
jgi:hypothetical protein